MRFNFRLPSKIVPTRNVKLMLKLSNVGLLIELNMIMLTEY